MSEWGKTVKTVLPHFYSHQILNLTSEVDLEFAKILAQMDANVRIRPLVRNA
jgi:hypothetical protein